MWKWIAIAVAGAGLAIVLTLVASPVPRPAPATTRVASEHSGATGKVEVPSLKYDFDTMEQATTGSHTFVIKNVGEGILELVARKPTCGCQKLILESHDVPEGAPTRLVLEEDEHGHFPEGKVFRVLPGGKVEATVIWNTKLETGQYREAVPLDTNDPDRPRITFEITGFVTPLVLFSTAEIRGEASTARDTTFDMAVASQVLSEIRIVNMTSAQGEVQLRAEQIDPAEAEKDFPDVRSLKCAYRVYVTVPKGLPVGPYRDKITLEIELPGRTDANGKPGKYETDIDLYVQVRGPVTVTRPLVNFGDIEVNKGAVEKLYVIIREVEKPVVEVESVTPDFLEAKIEPTPDPRRFVVVLSVPRDAPFGKFEGRVVLKTNHPQADTARIVVRGTVVEAL